LTALLAKRRGKTGIAVPSKKVPLFTREGFSHKDAYGKGEYLCKKS
jgi:hypothetical protein